METFVVRLWVPGDSSAAEAPSTLCGVVEHVSSGGRAPFVGVEELIAFLEGRLDGSRNEDDRGPD